MNKNNHRWQLGDKVKKKRGSSWRGTVCGFYNTAATPNGYSVVSLYEPGSVQVWPEAALEDWDGVMVEDELRSEITRLTEALRLQMEAKHKEAAEAKLWFQKAQEWKEALRDAEEREKGLREALGEICRDSNPDWTERRVYPNDVLDDIHKIAVDSFYGSKL